MNKTVATVIVTYNRVDSLKKNLNLLKLQTKNIDKIFVINNASTDLTQQYLESLNDNKIEVIMLPENTGGSGGFYEAMRIASKQGYDYIWGMDDDAFPEINALENILKATNSKGQKACFWSNCDNDDEFTENTKEVDSWMFVGFFIPKEIIGDVGLPRKDFFIYHDDSEYAKRIIKKGYKIFKVRDSKIEHGNFSTRENYSGNVFNKNITLMKISDWKLYYLVRNNILMYKWLESEKYKILFSILPKMLIKIIVLNKRQVRIFFKAYFDGLINKSGIVVRP